MHIPNNAERMQTISEIIQEELSVHVERGGSYNDDEASAIAQKAIYACMPELAALYTHNVIVEAGLGASVAESYQEIHAGLRVEAPMKKLAFQAFISTMNTEPPLSITNYDLCAVLAPRYIDPDPVDIVFGSELYVPFGAVLSFERAA